MVAATSFNRGASFFFFPFSACLGKPSRHVKVIFVSPRVCHSVLRADEGRQDPGGTNHQRRGASVSVSGSRHQLHLQSLGQSGQPSKGGRFCGNVDKVKIVELEYVCPSRTWWNLSTFTWARCWHFRRCTPRRCSPAAGWWVAPGWPACWRWPGTSSAGQSWTDGVMSQTLNRSLGCWNPVRPVVHRRPDATKVEQAVPLRENWALPYYACQVAALTGFLSTNVGLAGEVRRFFVFFPPTVWHC